ncbi:MAG: LuxR C-terminal-related transcriptional regulator [Burkholderiales bacterium]
MLTDTGIAPLNGVGYSADHTQDFGEIYLTKGQLRVLALLAKGESNKAIARDLGIAMGTVKTHLGAIFRAFKVRNRGQAIVAALRLKKVLEDQDAAHEDLPITSLLPFMTRRRFKRNELLFRKGDAGNEMYYVSLGTVNLEEIEVAIESGNLFGEIGLFAPRNERTWTARCKTDGELLAMSADNAMQAYYHNSQFALFVTRLIAAHLTADRLRFESRNWV